MIHQKAKASTTGTSGRSAVEDVIAFPAIDTFETSLTPTEMQVRAVLRRYRIAPALAHTIAEMVFENNRRAA